MSKFNGVKTNNAKIRAKCDIREYVMSQIDRQSVLDIFCGNGEMYNSVWHKAMNYQGIDKVKFFDFRNTLCGDADKLIRRVDLTRFNIFDIDSYGSPYEILDYLTQTIRPSGDVAFVITDGISIDLRLGRVCKGIRNLVGIENHVLKRASKMHDDIINIIAIEVSKRLKMRISSIRIAKGKTGASMRYWSITLTHDAV
jgi:hypothetical protein